MTVARLPHILKHLNRSKCTNTVDGRNPAPARMYKNPVQIMVDSPYQLVPNSFHLYSTTGPKRSGCTFANHNGKSVGKLQEYKETQDIGTRKNKQPWEPTFPSFLGVNFPYIWDVKPFIFHGFGVQGNILYCNKDAGLWGNKKWTTFKMNCNAHISEKRWTLVLIFWPPCKDPKICT